MCLLKYDASIKLPSSTDNKLYCTIRAGLINGFIVSLAEK